MGRLTSAIFSLGDSSQQNDHGTTGNNETLMRRVLSTKQQNSHGRLSTTKLSLGYFRQQNSHGAAQVNKNFIRRFFVNRTIMGQFKSTKLS